MGVNKMVHGLSEGALQEGSIAVVSRQHGWTAAGEWGSALNRRGWRTKVVPEHLGIQRRLVQGPPE